jgi:hypothetical protein
VAGGAGSIIVVIVEGASVSDADVGIIIGGINGDNVDVVAAFAGVEEVIVVEGDGKSGDGNGGWAYAGNGNGLTTLLG